MRIGRRFIEKLEYLAESEELTEPVSESLLVSMQKHPATVQAAVLDFGRLGCALEELTVESEIEGDLTVLAETISQQISYLQEGIEIIEQEPEVGQVQLRSLPPRAGQDGIAYYEGDLRRIDDERVQFRLRRYLLENGEERRRQVAMTLTRDIFERLLNDLTRIFAG